MNLDNFHRSEITASRRVVLFSFSIAWLLMVTSIAQADDELNLHLRTRAEIAPGSDRFREVIEPVAWEAKQTAIVICDMWNDHYCRNAARRVTEMVPTMNEVIRKARARFWGQPSVARRMNIV